MIVGTGQLASYLHQKIAHNPWLAQRVVGCVQLPGEAPFVLNGRSLPPVIGSLDALLDLIAAHQVRIVYFAIPLDASDIIEDLYFKLLDRHVAVHWVPDIFSLRLVNHSVREIAGVPVLTLSETPMTGTRLLIKSVEDLVLSAALLVLVAPLSLLGALNEDIIRMISAKKNEPEWLLEFRLQAYRHWLTMTEPQWPNVHYPKIDFQAISYYAAPKPKKKLSMDEVDPELLRTFEKLGVPMHERAALAGVAVDVIFDSVSVTTTYKEKLAEVGIIFCSISEAVHNHPELVKKYMGSVVPTADNYYAALNSAVFTDGSFCFIPKGVKCPMELSTYFRINTQDSGQFERTLIVAEDGASVSCGFPVQRGWWPSSVCLPGKVSLGCLLCCSQ